VSGVGGGDVNDAVVVVDAAFVAVELADAAFVAVELADAAVVAVELADAAVVEVMVVVEVAGHVSTVSSG